MNNTISLEELKQWKKNPLINPQTNRKIKLYGPTYNLFVEEYDKIKSLTESSSILSKLNQLINSYDDKDPISMNIFWTEFNNTKTIVYPLEQADQLVFYTDDKNKLRCLEKESILYLKKYNILNHPITMEPFPSIIFDSIKTMKIVEIKESINDIALNVFQIFTNTSVFIDYKLFIELDKCELLTFNTEIKDIWIQNLTSQQRELISNKVLFNKPTSELKTYKLEDLQLYFLDNIKTALECNKEELITMIIYIIIGALGIVIPTIKETYSDVSFSFS